MNQEEIQELAFQCVKRETQAVQDGLGIEWLS
jgi:hypothetical protein